MKFTLRDYQEEAKVSTYKAWRDERCVLGVLPTGGGKTVVFADVIKDALPGRTMVLAHRQELIFQAKEKIEQIAGCHVAIEMGDIKTNENQHDIFGGKADVIISSIQTQNSGGDGGGRIGKFNPMDFSLLIVDEAHHSVAASYQRVIDYYLTNPKLKVLGVTATPDRQDEEALGKVYGAVAFDYEIEDLIKSGWLVPIDGEMIEIESLDFSKIKPQAGDLNLAALSALMESEKNLHGIAYATIERAGDRRGIGFAASVDQAKTMSNIFNRHKNGLSSWICGKTEKGERTRILERFKGGDFKWLWNCAVATEGFDDPGVEVISMGRPTKSRALYAQMAGRATRPHIAISHNLSNMKMAAMRREMIKRSPKPACHILDFVGNSGQHKLMSCVDILSGNYSDDVVRETVSAMRKKGGKQRISTSIEEQEKREEEKKARELEESARKHKVVGVATYKSQKINPFDILGVKPVAPRGWDAGKVLSEKQRGVLKKAGFNPDTMEYGRAKQLVTMIIERWSKKLCTMAQAKILKEKGCDVNVSFANAAKMIDQIAKNHWRKPAEFVGLEVAPVEGIKSETLTDEQVPF